MAAPPEFARYRAADPRAEYVRLRAAYCVVSGSGVDAFDAGARRIARGVMARHPRAAVEQALAYAAAVSVAALVLQPRPLGRI